MNRLIPILAILALSAGCQTRKAPNPFAGPTRTLSPDGTVNDYSGKTAAGSGAVSDTSKSGIFVAAMEKVKGDQFTLITATRSAVVQPNFSRVETAEREHKDALAQLAKATPGTNPYAFAENMVRLAADSWKSAREAEANAPKADTGAIDIGFLSVGEGHAEAAKGGMLEFGLTLRGGQRSNQSANVQTSEKDTSTDASLDALLKTIREAFAKPILPPAVIPSNPPIVFPPIDPAPVSTNTVETITLPELPQ